MGSANLELVVIAACAWLAFVAFLFCSSSVSPYVLFFLLVCKSQLFTMNYVLPIFGVFFLPFQRAANGSRTCVWCGHVGGLELGLQPVSS